MNPQPPSTNGAGESAPKILPGALPLLDPADLLDDRLVLSALAGGRITAADLVKLGARDVLMLEKHGPAQARREEHWVSKAYRRIPDVRKNNCSVGLLHGSAAYALLEKREFARMSHVLVPMGPSLAAALLGLLAYGRRGILRAIGRTCIPTTGGTRAYLVLEVHFKPRDLTRQYAPAGLSPLEILRLLDGLDHVLLRGAEAIAAGNHQGDIDLLVSHEALSGLKERFSRRIGTASVDAYTDDGQGGHAYKSVPYFTPPLAREMLASAATTGEGIRLPSPRWRFIAFCFHLLFHGKCQADGPAELCPATFTKPGYHAELIKLAQAAGLPAPRDLDAMEALLKEAGVMPSLDLIGFYSAKDDFLKKRYFERTPVKPGLATFFVRDFGGGPDVVDGIRQRLSNSFEILVEGPVDDANRDRIVRGVRGGNWADSAAPGGSAPPLHWFVCWDPSPIEPSRRTRRKHPRVDNERIRLKDDLRKDFGGGTTRDLRVIHSSDNSMEAIDHLEHLGLTDHPEIRRRMA